VSLLVFSTWSIKEIIMTFRRSLLAAAVAVVALSSSFNASAQNIVLKASDTHPAGYPNVVAVENMGKKLDAATKGRITLKMFPGAVLGEEKPWLNRCRLAPSSSPASRWA
jgi:TRAP-type C4-dicarboxylate transport system substrate-binding protein